MKVFVTGASGFVGKHLVSLLEERGHSVFACVNKKPSEFSRKVNVLQCDILDSSRIYELLNTIEPDAIIHLAAISRIQDSWENPGSIFQVNTIGAINLLRAAKRAVPAAKIITVGSSEEYGAAVEEGVVLTEVHQCNPQNPYATSKFAMGQTCLQLAKLNGQTLIHVRPFNHFGPGQPKGFVISDFASQLAEIELGQREPELDVGDLSAWRDFTDVRDVANAYLYLLEKETEGGIYNVCSGKSRRIGDCLDCLVELSSLPVIINENKDKFKGKHVREFKGSYEKIKIETGWNPVKPFRKSLEDTLNYWRARVKNGKK